MQRAARAQRARSRSTCRSKTQAVIGGCPVDRRDDGDAAGLPRGASAPRRADRAAVARYGADAAPAYRSADDAADTGAATTGVEDAPPSTTAKDRARRQTDALAELTVEDAEKRLVLDWTPPLRHATFYKAIYRPAVLRANRLRPTAKLSPDQSFHSLRHTYASLCLAAGIRPIDIAELMGHRTSRQRSPSTRT